MIETEIIEAVRRGDRVAFRAMVDDLAGRMYSLAFRIVASEEDSRDIVQDTFAKVWQKRDSIRDPEAAEAWIKRITINRSYDLLRKRKREKDFIHERVLAEMESIISDDTPERSLINSEQAALLRALAGELSPKQRVVFVLSELEDYSHDEISRITGYTKSRIKSNLLHARKKIKEQIEKYLR